MSGLSVLLCPVTLTRAASGGPGMGLGVLPLWCSPPRVWGWEQQAISQRTRAWALPRHASSQSCLTEGLHSQIVSARMAWSCLPRSFMLIPKKLQSPCLGGTHGKARTSSVCVRQERGKRPTRAPPLPPGTAKPRTGPPPPPRRPGQALCQRHPSSTMGECLL